MSSSYDNDEGGVLRFLKVKYLYMGNGLYCSLCPLRWQARGFDAIFDTKLQDIADGNSLLSDSQHGFATHQSI